MRHIALLFAALSLPASVHAQTAQDTVDVRALIMRFETALRDRNAELLRRDYAPTAERLDVSGESQVGPDSIVAVTSRQYADPIYAAAVQTRSGPERGYFVRPDVLYITYYHRIETGRPAVATFPAKQDIETTLLVTKEQGRWLIQRESNLQLRLPDLLVPQSALTSSGAYMDSQVDEQVKMRNCKAPVFPATLDAKVTQGAVQVRYVVGADGLVEKEGLVIGSSTNPAFNQPAIDALLACNFSPAKIAGAPVRQLVDQVVRFMRPQ